MKCQFDEKTGWWNDKLMKCLLNARRWNEKLMKEQVYEATS